LKKVSFELMDPLIGFMKLGMRLKKIIFTIKKKLLSIAL
jgi:hypothetical protein